MPNLLTGTGRALLRGNDDAAWVSLLQSNATYAWASASGLTLATWTDVVSSVVATAGGTGTSIGTLAGRPAAVLNGSGYYRTAAFAAGAIAQPCAAVIVAQRTGAVAQGMALDGLPSAGRNVVYVAGAATGWSAFAGTLLSSGNATTNAVVIRSVFNGNSSSISINGGAATSGAAGTQTLTGVTIGNNNTNNGGLTGSIADVIIVAGADYVARAAVIEAAALVRYGLG